MGISLVGLSKAAVLAALYNASKPQGMGFLHYDPTPMTEEEAESLLLRWSYFDYLKGRVMKVDLSGDELNPYLYDRGNGLGAAEEVIAELRSTGDSNDAGIQVRHDKATQASALSARSQLSEVTQVYDRQGYTEVSLGLGDVANELQPIIDTVIQEGVLNDSN